MSDRFDLCAQHAFKQREGGAVSEKKQTDGEEPCSRNWWIEEYDDGKFRIMAGNNRAVMCRGDGYLSRKYAKHMGEWMFEHGSHPGAANIPITDRDKPSQTTK